MTTPAQKALVAAFNELVLERPFDEIHVANIIKRADVSRSTFYEHFQGKEALLRYSLDAVLIPIAEVCAGESGAVNEDVGELNSERLRFILDHFLEVKPIIDLYFLSPLFEIVETQLSELIEQRLSSDRRKMRLVESDELACRQIAAATLGLIRAWLSESSTSDSEEIAGCIITSSRSLRGVYWDCS